MGQALAGLKVLELSRVLAGPSAGQVLADLGADVVKVEHPVGGDDTRGWGPPYLSKPDGSPSEESAYYLGANRNKRSVAIDFSTPEGQALVADMASKADIVLENFRPGSLEKYGLDYDVLRQSNPGLIYCSITGFGQDGPRRDLGGDDFIVQALGGLMSVTGLPDGVAGGEPMKVGVPVADLFTGLYAVIGVLAALASREKTGLGQSIDLSLFDVQVAMLANQGMNHLVGGNRPERLGNDHPNVVPCGAFKTTDSYVVIAIGNDAQFNRFCEVMGRADLADDPRYTTNAQRSGNRDALNIEIANALASQPTEIWLDRFAKAKVTAGPVNTIDKVFKDEQSLFRELRVEIPHPFGTAAVIASPLRLSDTPVTYRRAPPLLGEHTDEVLAELGLGGPALERLRTLGVVR